MNDTEAYSDETLTKADDGELYSLEYSLKRRVYMAPDDRSRKAAETELCYVQREIHVRELRAAAAEAYSLAEHTKMLARTRMATETQELN